MTEQRSWQLIAGDIRDADFGGGFDAVLCDPPYELGFMGKRWDASGVAFDPRVWGRVLSACKPGAPLLAFGGTRTYHRMTCAIEDAGFEIRDCLAWLYGSGFPKSLDVSKALDRAAGAVREVVGHKRGVTSAETGRGMPGKATGVKQMGIDVPITAPETDAARAWSGYGTALKPAFEPCVLARAPLTGTVSANVTEHGCGALAIDAGRIGNRWPANVLLDEQAAAILDASVDEAPSRFFYTSKASRDDRDHGLLRALSSAGARTGRADGSAEITAYAGATGAARNPHPTVKPTDLTEYLARLILPPRRATPRRLLVPFAGSGSEMVGALRAGWEEVVGVELVYFDLARERLTNADTAHQISLFGDIA
jgi:site-specific DNA-methyltransferase (adenine-specific)